jgi:ElaB/YqjD/DUF883 family membrane-anchored ribosome-binding protein
MSILGKSYKSEFNSGKDQLQHLGADISQEFKSFVSDIEDLIKETATLTGNDLVKGKAKIAERIEDAKKSVGDASQSLVAAKLTNKYAHEEPWIMIGAGAAITFLLGAMLARRS